MDNSIRLSFNDVFKHYLEESGLSFDRLAARSRTTPSYLHRLVTGKANRPGRNFILRLAFGLSLDIDNADELLKSAGHLPLLGDEPPPPAA